MIDKKNNDLPVVFALSGGQTSAMMTKLFYRHDQNHIALFCDTGREHPATYKFLLDFEANENIPIYRTGNENSFAEMVKKNKAVPNQRMRFCTEKLKIEATRRFMLANGFKEYTIAIGFRADEKERVLRRRPRWKSVKDWYPLFDAGITKPDVNEFWKKQSYQLEIPSILGNCTLCFQKGKAAILAILREFPELAEPWVADEEATGHTYFKDISIKNILITSQSNLFAEQKTKINLAQLAPAFNCLCTS
jgi:hypothetical protein